MRKLNIQLPTRVGVLMMGLIWLTNSFAFAFEKPANKALFLEKTLKSVKKRAKSSPSNPYTFLISAPPIAVDDTLLVSQNTVAVVNPTLNDILNGQLTGLSIVEAPKHGSLGFTSIDTLIYKPNEGFCGNDTLYYRICNETYTCDTAMIIITVKCDGLPTLENPPLAVDDAISTYKNTRVDIAVLSNDSLNSDLIHPLSIIQFPTHGAASVVTNALSYLPQNNFCSGYDTLTYEICNAFGCDTAMVVIYTVCEGGNNNAHLPIAKNDTFSITRNGFLVFKPTVNDTINGVLTAVNIAKNCNNGSVGFTSLDTLVYFPQMGFCGVDSIRYRICNEMFLCDTATVFINISCDSDSSGSVPLPEATDDVATTREGKTVNMGVLSNDNPNGILIHPLRIVRYPSKGVASISINDITYTPLNGFCGGRDTMAYEICNATGCDTAEVVISVNCDLNPRVDDPIAKDDRISTNRNAVIKFNPTINDTLNGVLLAVEFLSPPRHGSIGSQNVDSLVYAPYTDYCGLDTLEYRVCRTDFKCATAFIYITVNCTPLNDRPDALNDAVSVLKNTPLSINVLKNDAINGALNTPLSIVAFPKHGTTTIDAQNNINYTPQSNYCNGNDTLSYKICTANGCDTAFVFMTILCKNLNAPVAVNDATLVLKNKPTEINVTANDALNGILDSITIVQKPKNGVVVIANNNIVFTPNLDFCDAFDSLTYAICTVNGCDTAQLFISIRCDTTTGKRPKAKADTGQTMQAQLVSIAVLNNDSLFFEILDSIHITQKPNQGSVEIDVSNNIIYTPKIAFCGGNDTLFYALCSHKGCDTAMVVIYVACDTNMNRVPEAMSDIAYTMRGKAIMIPILQNDSLRRANIFKITKFAKHGTAALDTTTNQLYYHPSPTFCGSFDSVVYEICNFKGCDTALVVIVVGCDTAFQMKPIANFDTAKVAINSPVIINVLKNDNLNGSILFEITVQPRHGLVTFSSDSMIFYVPNNEFWGRDSFTYIICNLAGCDTATVYITIHGGKDIVVYNAFSPNGDKINDKFIIRGIENYPNNELIVYNRWGNEMFKRKGYNNDDAWEGNWDGQLILDGTYFYIIFLNDDKKQVKTGYLQVHR